MTVYEFCELLTDAAIIEIFSFEAGEAVYKGYSDDLPDEIGESIISSIDPVHKESEHLTINIECIE